MKKLLFVCGFAFLGITATYAQTPEAKTTTTENIKQDGPKIEFETELIDYGSIENGADGYREFKFKNAGNAPLVITDAKGSCGCTVPTVEKNVPIAPGATSVIKVKYDTTRPGTFSKSVTITSNAVNAPTKVIRIKGEVGPKPEATTPAAPQK